jgi:hypothetical protein
MISPPLTEYQGQEKVNIWITNRKYKRVTGLCIPGSATVFLSWFQFKVALKRYILYAFAVSLMTKRLHQAWAAARSVWISLNLIKQWTSVHDEHIGSDSQDIWNAVVKLSALVLCIHEIPVYSFGPHIACYDRGIPWVSFIHPGKCLDSRLQHHPYISKRGSRRHNKEVNQILIKHMKIERNISSLIKMSHWTITCFGHMNHHHMVWKYIHEIYHYWIAGLNESIFTIKIP